MKQVLSLTLLLIAASTARAEKIYCYFNEPSVNYIYNSDTNEFTVNTPGDSKVLVGNVIFGGNGVIKVSDTGNKYFLEMNTTQQGSDGASDYIYPFLGISYVTIINPKGGCETDHSKKYKP